MFPTIGPACHPNDWRPSGQPLSFARRLRDFWPRRAQRASRRILGEWTVPGKHPFTLRGNTRPGTRLHNYGKSSSWIGKSTINGSFSIAMLNHQRVECVYIYITNYWDYICLLLIIRLLLIIYDDYMSLQGVWPPNIVFCWFSFTPWILYNTALNIPRKA